MFKRTANNQVTNMEHNDLILNYLDHSTVPTSFIGMKDISTNPNNPYYTDIKSYFLYQPQVYDEKPQDMQRMYSPVHVRSTKKIPYSGRQKMMYLVPYYTKQSIAMKNEKGERVYKVDYKIEHADKVTVPHMTDPYQGNGFGNLYYAGAVSPQLFGNNKGKVLAPPLSKSQLEALKTGKHIADVARTLTATHDKATKTFFRQSNEYGKTIFEFIAMSFGDEVVKYVDETSGKVQEIKVSAQNNIRLVPVKWDTTYRVLPPHYPKEKREEHLNKALRISESFIKEYAVYSAMKRAEQEADNGNKANNKVTNIPDDYEEYLTWKKSQQHIENVDSGILINDGNEEVDTSHKTEAEIKEENKRLREELKSLGGKPFNSWGTEILIQKINEQKAKNLQNLT